MCACFFLWFWSLFGFELVTYTPGKIGAWGKIVQLPSFL